MKGRRQTVLVVAALIAAGLAGVWVSYMRFREHQNLARHAATTHAEVLLSARQLAPQTEDIRQAHPISAIDVMPSLVQSLRDSSIEPAVLTAHDIGQGQQVPGQDAQRRLVTVILEGLPPGDLSTLLSRWEGRPPVRSIQLSHTGQADENAYQVRLVLDVIEPIAKAQESAS